MTCDEGQIRIMERLAGEIDPVAEKELERHLAGCDNCRREAELMGSIGHLIREVEEEPVPRHFFVYDPPRRFFGWFPFGQPNPGWAIAFAAALILLVGLGLVSVSRLNVRYTQGTLLIAFGEIPALGTEQAQWRADLLEESRQAARAEVESGWAGLKEDFTRQVKAGQLAHERQLDERFGALKTELQQDAGARDRSLQQGLEATLGRFGQKLLAQHQSDMLLLSRRLDRSESLDRLQASQNSAVMSALVQISDARQRP